MNGAFDELTTTAGVGLRWRLKKLAVIAALIGFGRVVRVLELLTHLNFLLRESSRILAA